MVGYPGSGKTHFARTIFCDYVDIARDDLKTWQKCVKKAETELNKKRSVIITNTNPNIESRKRYLDISKKLNIPCRCIEMTTSYSNSVHNADFRKIIYPESQKIPTVVFNVYRSKYQKPTIEEGFYKIDLVDFSIELSENSFEKWVYFQYLSC
jgi:bifunctional polynucleotide phosphatase/kinase